MFPHLRKWFLLFLLLANAGSYAQEKTVRESNEHPVWKKRVLRSIYVAGDTTSKDGKGSWMAFFTSLADFVLKGKATAYKGPDVSRKMGMKTLKEQIATQYDTVIIVDPVTNEERKNIVTTEFDFTTISKVVMCEEWTFDPQTKKTAIRVASVAPGQDIYDGEGKYMRTDNLFWIKWEDFQRYADAYQEFDALYDLGIRVWKDHLKGGSIMSDGGAADIDLEKDAVWKGKILRKTHLYTDTALSYELNLVNGYDSSIAQVLFYAALTGRINAYSDQDYEQGPKLNMEELDEISKMPPDTLNMGNKMTGSEPIWISVPYCLECITDYYVHERWKYSYNTGITEINYVDIAPVRNFRFLHFRDKRCVVDDNTNSITPQLLYWFNYDDASEILKHYNEYNHSTIEFQLWQDRFKEKKHENKAR